ncbi:hypothetical protein CTI14_45955, partial [Methylobacterium radiotolerans]
MMGTEMGHGSGPNGGRYGEQGQDLPGGRRLVRRAIFDSVQSAAFAADRKLAAGLEAGRRVARAVNTTGRAAVVVLGLKSTPACTAWGGTLILGNRLVQSMMGTEMGHGSGPNGGRYG